MSLVPALYSHQNLIILRLNNSQYWAISERFKFCMFHEMDDIEGFLYSFLIEVPRPELSFAPKRFRFERQTHLVTTKQVYLVFVPKVITGDDEKYLAEYLLEHYLCRNLVKHEPVLRRL